MRVYRPYPVCTLLDTEVAAKQGGEQRRRGPSTRHLVPVARHERHRAVAIPDGEQTFGKIADAAADDNCGRETRR